MAFQTRKLHRPGQTDLSIRDDPHKVLLWVIACSGTVSFAKPA